MDPVEFGGLREMPWMSLSHSSLAAAWTGPGPADERPRAITDTAARTTRPQLPHIRVLCAAGWPQLYHKNETTG